MQEILSYIFVYWFITLKLVAQLPLSSSEAELLDKTDQYLTEI